VGVFMMGWADKSPEGVPVLKPEVKKEQDKWFARNLPGPVIEFLQEFRGTTTFAHLADEFYHNQEYKKSWGKTPFPPIFVTADAVVTCAGHVLVIRRGGNPGKGLLALPGGFVRENERVKDAAIRELKEETRIKVDKIILESSIVASDVFDYPGRSLRGRTITHAFHVKLRGGKLPEVKATGADDAKGAFWMPMMEVLRRADEFFEDHIHIVNRFINNS
jgi:bifunctional NMN adenylyltransferase/nudix hydrolase